eukprot:Phypoly_transcript_12957.p1 GENE.Phypoly_transcript_12957~~Phypoly_transcript_12957.p1  ORF type:complete len:335 (-),score=24.47 Phypoly_transcript_12957:94-1038(-)
MAQKEDILCKSLHENANNLVVHHTKDRGRHFIAAKDFEENECVILEEPYAVSVYVPVLKNTCDVCFAHTPNKVMPLRCTLCKQMYYCSKKCRDIAKYHQGIECEVYQKFDSDRIDDCNIICAVTLAIRVLALRNHEQTFPTELNYTHFSQLILHKKEEYPKDLQQKLDEATDYLMSIGSGAGMFMGVTRDELMDVILRYYSNSFGLWDEPEWTEASNCTGVGIYLKACFFNHSCSPNIKARRTERAFSFLATETIKKGTEMCISYVDPSLPKKQRQEELMQEFSFLCTCETCKNEPDEPSPKKKQKKKRKVSKE